MLKFHLHRRHACGLPLIVAVLLPGVALAQAADSVRAVDNLFQWASAVGPGCAVGVARDGRVLLTRAYGTANLSLHAPIATETLFDAGSVAKQFTSAAIMLLVADGKLTLDDPVRRHIPELRDYGSPLVVRDLLGHTSGIRELDILSIFSGWGVAEAAYTNAEMIDLIARQQSLNFRPGTAFAYSNSNYVLAATIVRRVSGSSFAEFTKRRLFDPARMSRTQWRDEAGAVVDGLANGYDVDAQGIVRDRPLPAPIVGPGGLLTTVGDLLKWNDALSKGTIVPPALARLMEARVRFPSGQLSPSGLGLVTRDYNGRTEIEHDGMTTGFRAYLARYPEDHLSVAVLCNQRSRDAGTLGHGVADIFLRRAETAPSSAARVEGTALTPEQLAAAAGLYRTSRTGEVVRLSATNDAWQSSGDIWFGGGRFIPLSPTSFSLQGDAARGELVLDGRGAVRGYRMWPRSGTDTVIYERVEEWTPTQDELAAFPGRYTSAETNGAISISARNQQLLLFIRPAKALSFLTPVFRDAFRVGSFGIISFQRDAQGKVTGFVLDHPMAMGILFSKQ